MTDRLHSLTVVLDKNIRVDDAEELLKAIGLLRGVLDVRGNVADAESYMAESRAIEHWRDQLRDVLWPRKL